MRLRVLVVDDEPLARERLTHLVEDLPDVELAGTAGTGEEALMLAGSLRPDVILLDIRMPGMGGLEAAHHLARLPEPPAVIFTTAYDEHALAAFDAQAAGYLLKPVRLEKLQEALARARVAVYPPSFLTTSAASLRLTASVPAPFRSRTT